MQETRAVYSVEMEKQSIYPLIINLKVKSRKVESIRLEGRFQWAE